MLLNNLASSGYLSRGLANVQGGRWRQTLIATLLGHLEALVKQSPGDVDRQILVQTFRLLSYLPIEASDFAPTFVQFAQQYGGRVDDSVDSAIEDWRASGPLNDGHMLSIVLNCISTFALDQNVRAATSSYLNSEDGFKNILRRWHWNAEVMEKLTDLAERVDYALT